MRCIFCEFTSILTLYHKIRHNVNDSFADGCQPFIKAVYYRDYFTYTGFLRTGDLTLFSVFGALLRSQKIPSWNP